MTGVEEVEEEEMTGAKEEVVEEMTGAKEEVVEEMTGAKEGHLRQGRKRREKQVPAGEDDDDKKLEIVQSDMDSWESSGQWGFSCYSYSKAPLSGFTDLSPEELRLEYYSTRESGDLQGYVNGITQLLNQWRSRVQELKVMNPATRAALLAEINNPAPQASSGGFGLATLTGFGSTTSSVETKGFGAPAAADSFSFAAPSGGFGSSAAPPSSTGFGSALAAPTQPPLDLEPLLHLLSPLLLRPPISQQPLQDLALPRSSLSPRHQTLEQDLGVVLMLQHLRRREAAVFLEWQVEGLGRPLLRLQQEPGLRVELQTVCFHM
ncbi:hypothetical protein F7725_024825 [Dissostichus mawsoni]|uniref:Uncharacterized protein n=1 Tax=Dissostichus mawsoni TaxID=36200 RepID=A0A7J5X9N0_DISMA|nr:hypothetical protein F7725_024825 [Dissostichus mawsoni]